MSSLCNPGTTRSHSAAASGVSHSGGSGAIRRKHRTGSDFPATRVCAVATAIEQLQRGGLRDPGHAHLRIGLALLHGPHNQRVDIDAEQVIRSTLIERVEANGSEEGKAVLLAFAPIDHERNMRTTPRLRFVGERV